ncbi:PAS domain-containing protein [Sphingomonas sp. LHG3406-1]|uniref:PAS domain-containing protein n=1 Tax=Sphingomonas sp. LHG3406-1 TaxID=2804617 RepID=UPI002601A956|nr:PAS domain-containing protein [Sphingomonas sp. LHG3406-1]
MVVGAAVIVCLGGILVQGPWRLIALPAIGYLGFVLLRRAQQSEAALLRVEENYRELVDLPLQMTFVTDGDGRTLHVGKRWTEWTGLDLPATTAEWSEAIHPDDREKVGASWSHSMATGTNQDVEFRLRFRDGRYRRARGRAVPQRGASGTVVRWIGQIEDVHDQRAAEEQLRQTASLLEMIGRSTDSLIYAKDLDGRMLYGNRALEQLTGMRMADILGKTDSEWNSNPAEAEALQAVDQQVLAAGRTQDIEEVFTGADGVTRHYRSLKSPLKDRSGKVIGVVGVSTDITEAREAEEREALLTRELDHRAKNLLAVVQSVVALTRAGSLDEFKAAVEGRILALGRAHSMLAASRWEGADLLSLLNEELAPYGEGEPDRIHLHGPSLLLKPAAAQSIGLIAHELATNAVKYGSLSSPAGRLDVRWDIHAARGNSPRLRFAWVERGGPPVEERSRSGFGSRLIRSSVERQLGGTLTMDWNRDGLEVRFDIALDRSRHDEAEGESGKSVKTVARLVRQGAA